MDPTTTGCEAVEPLFTRQDPLSREELATLTAHLRGCPGCRAVDEVSQALRAYGAGAAGDAERQRAQARFEHGVRRARWTPLLALSPLLQAPLLGALLCGPLGLPWARVGWPLVASAAALTVLLGAVLAWHRRTWRREATFAERQGMEAAFVALEARRREAEAREGRLTFAGLGVLLGLTALVPGVPAAASALLGALAVTALLGATGYHLRVKG